MAKMGRPQIQIDKEQFEKLCNLCCTEQEIAGYFNCSIDTVKRWCKRTYKMTFADTYKIKSAGGKISLRRWQMECAKKGNSAMLIWLGKQYLGQTEKVEQTTSLNAPVIIMGDDEIE